MDGGTNGGAGFDSGARQRGWKSGLRLGIGVGDAEDKGSKTAG